MTDIVRMNWFGGAYIDQKPENMFARFSTSDAETFLKVFDEASIVQGSAQDWIADRSGPSRGRAPHEEVRLEARPEDHAQGRHLPRQPRAHDPRDATRAPTRPASTSTTSTIEEALPRVKGFVGWYWIKADSLAAVERLPKEIDAMFDNSSVPTRTETEKEMQNGFVSMLGNVKLMVTGISTIIVFVILLIAGNTMAMTARERVTEIAVLRTLGFPKRTILGADPRARASSSPSSAVSSARDSSSSPLPGLPAGAPLLADGRLRRRNAPLPRDRRHGLRRLRPRRDPRGPRSGGPIRPALDSGRPETGRLKGL